MYVCRFVYNTEWWIDIYNAIKALYDKNQTSTYIWNLMIPMDTEFQTYGKNIKTYLVIHHLSRVQIKVVKC